MANLTATAMNLLRQQERFVCLPPPDVLWQMPTPYDDEIDAMRHRVLATQDEMHQKMARAITNIPAALTNNRHNKRLLLCQP